MGKRPYSMEYTARGTPRRYLLSGIPPGLWAKVRRQAKREHLSVRYVILDLLDAWLSPERVEQRERTQAAMRRAVKRAQETKDEPPLPLPGEHVGQRGEPGE